MSLTRRIKETSLKEFTASDGTTYILQKVDTVEAFVSQGITLDILAHESDFNEAQKTGDFKAFLTKLEKEDPEKAKRFFSMGMTAKNRTLKAGLLGEIERYEGGSMRRIMYRHVEKNAEELNAELNEVNVALIPDDLKDELADAINAIGRPALEGADVRTFPKE